MMERAGLEDVIAVTTRIGRVDGDRGELVVRGERMEDYAPRSGFEATMVLLWNPEDDRAAQAAGRLGDARVAAFERLREAGLFERTRGMGAIEFQRAAIDTLASRGDALEDAVDATAMVAVAAAAWARRSAGEAPVAPDPSLPHAADMLQMATGSHDGASARALETYLVTVSDHGMNASTFTARVIASTQSDLFSAIAGALGALKGPLHGGAPGPVLDMLDAIGTPEAAEDWVRSELTAGRRIMGMGHRVYRVRDPRAAIFERALARLNAENDSPRLALARAVERAAEKVLAERHPQRALKANVEFYTAVLLEAVGIPRELFTATFAAGRVLGWCAHVMEQRREGRLIRPRSEYVGIGA